MNDDAVGDHRRRPMRLEVLAARAQVALNQRTGVSSAASLLALAATGPADIAQLPSGPAEAAAPPATLLSPSGKHIRALAYIAARPMQGRDVLDLQRQLVALGYGQDNLIDGIFQETTEVAVRRFQTDYDILNDGVCGRVTQRVLKFLENERIDTSNPATVQQRHMISFIVRAQQGGFVVIDLVSRSMKVSTDRNASLVDAMIDQVGRMLQSSITTLTGMQAWTLDSADIMTRDEDQIAGFANNIKAELMITLSVADAPDSGPGCATYYFGTAPDVYSHVGRPLAEFVQADVVRLTQAPDRDTHAEYSRLFEQTQLPTIRVEFGNVADSSDRARLGSEEYLASVATGIAWGVRKFYLLGQNDQEVPPPLNLGVRTRR